MRMITIWGFVLLLAGVALSACGPADEAVAPVTYTAYTNAATGLTFAYPETWAISETGEGQITIASNQEVIDEEAYTGGSVVNIFVGPADLFGEDLVAALNELVGLMVENESTTIIREAAATTIQGQEAASVTLAGREGNREVTLEAAIVRGESALAFMAAIYENDDAAADAPIISHIVNSMTLQPVQE